MNGPDVDGPAGPSQESLTSSSISNIFWVFLTLRENTAHLRQQLLLSSCSAPRGVTRASGATEDKGLDLAELVSQAKEQIVRRAEARRWNQLDISCVLLAGKRDRILSVIKHRMRQKVEGLWQGLAGWILYF